VTKKTKSLEERNWSTLGQVKTYIESQNKGKRGRAVEKIICFNGAYLETSKATYTLSQNGLHVKKK
jgi:hypothetical protein